MRNLVVCFAVLILASCVWAKTKDNYIAHGVPARCYYIPNPGESKAAEKERWWATDLSRDEFLACYELEKKTDLKLHAIKKKALGELQVSLQETQDRIQKNNERYWAIQQQMYNDYLRNQHYTLCHMYKNC